jgi:tRNA dimethylallyltransferase
MGTRRHHRRVPRVSQHAKGDTATRMDGADDRVVLIAGPTASGKSALAVALAERLGGIVINTDSMQVYRDLFIITARPGAAELARAPHRLYGHVDAAENYSVGRFVEDAGVALDEARAERRVAIFVGGSGLYFKALTRGLAAIPPIPPDIRANIRGRLEADGVAALYDELARRDPVSAARLKAADRVRIARALEVFEATGRTISDWHRDGLPPLLAGARIAKVFLTPDRAALYRRIDARFDAMLAAGALDEVRALDARRLDPLLPAMKAHGVPWLIRHLAGEMTLSDAAEAGKRDTRHYAKRQFTWFRHQLGDWPRADPEAALDVIVRAIGG